MIARILALLRRLTTEILLLMYAIAVASFLVARRAWPEIIAAEGMALVVAWRARLWSQYPSFFDTDHFSSILT